MDPFSPGMEAHAPTQTLDTNSTSTSQSISIVLQALPSHSPLVLVLTIPLLYRASISYLVGLILLDFTKGTQEHGQTREKGARHSSQIASFLCPSPSAATACMESSSLFSPVSIG
jgi:hypothetical protein